MSCLVFTPGEVQIRYQEKVLHCRVVGMAQGSGHSPELLEIKECLDSALSHRVWILGGALWSQELGSVIPMGPFRLRMFCSSIRL